MFVCTFICISFHVLCLLVPKSLLLLSYQMILIALNRRQKANIQIIVLSVMADELYLFSNIFKWMLLFQILIKWSLVVVMLFIEVRANRLSQQ